MKPIPKCMVILTPLASLAAVALRVFEGPPALLGLAIAIAAGAILGLLAHVYVLVEGMQAEGERRVRGRIRIHILAHAVAFGYLARVLLSGASTPALDLLWLPPLLYFFHTGRQSWAGLHRRFGTKLYGIFYRGNTAMLIMVPVLSLIAPLLLDCSGQTIAERMVTFYFTVHCLLIGVAVWRIAGDLETGRVD